MSAQAPGLGPKLWTKNFTIITIGSVISMMGNVMAGFAISLMVLDYTESVFLYTLFMVVYNLPKLIMPLVAGPWLDRFSRRRAIYSLDFTSAAIYLGVFLLLRVGVFSYGPFLIICALVGAIDSTYLVAYESLYPTLVEKENYRKAYSIASVLSTLSMAVAPVAAFAYEWAGGAAPVFLAISVCFLTAAIFETQIKSDETHMSTDSQPFTLRTWGRDFKDGIRYIRGEPGLMIITVYFFFSYLGDGAGALTLPYFRATEGLGVMAYMLVMAGGILGRVAGGRYQYSHKLPAERKFTIARMVYILTSLIVGTYLFLPNVYLMMALQVCMGVMGVTSYNIRIASTQTYVPNSHRARFNGAFQMIVNLGAVVGQLVCGALGDVVPIRAVFLGVMVMQLVAIFFTMGLKGHHVKPIYNLDI